MIYKYFWQEIKAKDPSLIQDLSSGYFLLKTDDGVLVVEENYVPLLELVNLIGKWDMSGSFEYCPDGFEQNPLISFKITQDVVELGSPDTRARNERIIISMAEFRDFYVSFSRDVRNDIANMLAENRSAGGSAN